MKRILIFSFSYVPHIGGAEVAIKEITDRARDISFVMLTRERAHAFTKQFGGSPREERIGNVLVHRVATPKVLFPIIAALKARALHRRERFDGAWAMMTYMSLPALFSGLPYALTLQDGDTTEHVFGRLRIRPFVPLIRYAFRRARVISALSTFLAGWAREAGYRGAVEIIPNGADVRKFAGEPLPHEGIVLITSSRLVHKNGIDTVIRALPLLPGVRFVVCGTGPDERALRTLARELGVAERVVWRGYVDHEHLPEALRRADIFVRASRSEGFGASFVEAFAAGIPVIATRVGGLRDFITSDVAWPVRPERPGDIVAAVRDILGDKARTGGVVVRAKRLAQEKYDWGLVAKAMRERVFSRILERGEGGLRALAISLDDSALRASSATAQRLLRYDAIAKAYTLLVRAGRSEERELSERVRVIGIPRGNKVSDWFRMGMRAAGLLWRGDFNVLSVQDTSFFAFLGWLLARLFGVGLEIQVHGFEKHYGLRRAIARFVLPRAQSVRAVSERLKKHLVREFRVRAERISVVPIAVLAGAVHFSHGRAACADKKYRPADTGVCGSCARAERE